MSCFFFMRLPNFPLRLFSNRLYLYLQTCLMTSYLTYRSEKTQQRIYQTFCGHLITLVIIKQFRISKPSRWYNCSHSAWKFSAAFLQTCNSNISSSCSFEFAAFSNKVVGESLVDSSKRSHPRSFNYVYIIFFKA